jgi:hypothetical protein
MRFALLFGCMSITVCAVLVTMKLRNLNRKPNSFPPIQRYNVIQFRRRAESVTLQKFLNRSDGRSV